MAMKKEALVTILRKYEPTITLLEFKQKHPKLKYSQWQFYSARKAAMGEVYPSRARRNEKRKYIPKEQKVFLHEEFKRNPDVKYSDLLRDGKVTMSDAMFYLIRTEALGQKRSGCSRVYTVIDEIQDVPKDHLVSVNRILEKINAQSGTNILISIVELANGSIEVRTNPKGRRQ